MTKLAEPVADLILFDEKGRTIHPFSLQEGDRDFQVAVIKSGEQISCVIDLGKLCEKLLILVPEKIAKSDHYSVLALNNVVPEQKAPIPHNRDLMGSCLGWVLPIGGIRFVMVECETTQDEDRTIYIRGI